MLYLINHRRDATIVLILTDRFDSHADIVIHKLTKHGVPFFRFDLDVDSLNSTLITFTNGMWSVQQNGHHFFDRDISCVWCRRPFVELSLEEQQVDDIDFRIWKNEWNKTLLGLYNTLKDVPWLNPLRKAYKGENKYYQMQLAQEIGFIMPETIVSNDKERLSHFVKVHHGALLKLMSQDIYAQGKQFLGFYTNRISEEDMNSFGGANENPIVLQNYIEKGFEVRYTVVGKNHLVCRIDSQCSEKAKYDWRRYDIPRTPHLAIQPPQDIRDKVDRFMSRLQLEYGALDFIVTPNGDWVFLEINCMGQWLWIEQLAALPISDAIVEWIKVHIQKK